MLTTARHEQGEAIFPPLIARRAPELVIEHIDAIARHLEKRSGRTFWLAAMAMQRLASHDPETVFAYLPLLLRAADGPSVIARDAVAFTLCTLGAVRSYEQRCADELLKLMEQAPVNQFPSYAEHGWELLTRTHKRSVTKLIERRMEEMNTEAKSTRLSKILQKSETPRT